MWPIVWTDCCALNGHAPDRPGPLLPELVAEVQTFVRAATHSGSRRIVPEPSKQEQPREQKDRDKGCCQHNLTCGSANAAAQRCPRRRAIMNAKIAGPWMVTTAIATPTGKLTGCCAGDVSGPWYQIENTPHGRHQTSDSCLKR
jgi:hypothetical protein